MKMPAINGVIIVHGDHTEARNIEKNTHQDKRTFTQSLNKKKKKKQKMRSLKQKLKLVKRQKEYLPIH